MTQQQRFADDFRAWQRTRDAACQSMRESMAGGAFAGAAAAVTCPTVMTGVGAVGCAVSVAGLVYANRLVAQNAEQCMASYPGQGNW